MLQERTWYEYKRAIIEMIPKGVCGGYVVADENKNTLYVGKSESRNVGIRGRLLSHFTKRRFRSARYFKFAYESLFNYAKDLEAQTIKTHIERHGKRPKYNKQTPRERRGLW
ncbi:MAG: GIY-YIG nuclease family protein [Chloroflexi bacterium]|nr:GIY-YIG nuclease family protein [Chloroflexota bacterium]MBM3173659.1 GIY-YIG nuclease family protein [Chloroflexota bacterium]